MSPYRKAFHYLGRSKGNAMVSRFTVKDGIVMEIDELNGRHRYVFPKGYFYALPDAESMVEQFYKNLDRIPWIEDRRLPEIV